MTRRLLSGCGRKEEKAKQWDRAILCYQRVGVPGGESGSCQKTGELKVKVGQIYFDEGRSCKPGRLGRRRKIDSVKFICVHEGEPVFRDLLARMTPGRMERGEGTTKRTWGTPWMWYQKAESLTQSPDLSRKFRMPERIGKADPQVHRRLRFFKPSNDKDAARWRRTKCWLPLSKARAISDH